MSRTRSVAAGALAIAFAAAAPCALSDSVKIPDASQKAAVSQTIGMTDVAVSYHRPVVNKREIWGKLVPYDQVWRAGANENTTVSFSTPVTIEGKPLAAGTYGLHMLPGKDSWTVIFSKNSTSWGSFSYDEKEDALRVTVKPHVAPFREALAYEFEDVKTDSAVLELDWEKLAVPVRIGKNDVIRVRFVAPVYALGSEGNQPLNLGRLIGGEQVQVVTLVVFGFG